ncbi:uridine-cytidine kinase-like 1 isoform X3 [Cyanistes caeruleus]|uniref:uridine-cytidine kinase-like 1 isoform X3 n=1 Tax=Cyanistes caeruleus TaxID=156563 RepID=UPI000CDB492F|nr:uridine-cytidine kinase-like 1 isoform X3 [Cyanistes caeruleus]
MSSPPAFSSVRISGCWALGPDGGNSSAESLDRLYPAVGSTKPPRKRTTSQCKSEPPLLRTSKRTIYTAGRPPWYNEHGTQSKEAFVIGLGGGSASGKTTVATMIIEALDVPWVVLLSMDSFYKVLTKQQQEQAASNDFNFDHPDAFDFDLIIATLKKLKQGKSVKIPIYDFTTHSRKKEWKTLYGANVIIFEGIMAFADKELLKLLDLKIFVDTDSDIRLVRRLRRDISERGRDIEGVIKQYNKFVKPAFDQYIQPTMRLADIVVPRGSGNTVAIDLIVQHVHSQLEERELSVRGSCAGICEETNAYGSVLVVALTVGSGRGLCRVSCLTNLGGGSWGRQLMGSCFAGAVWARQRWGCLKEKLYPKNGTCFPRRHHGETPHNTEWHPSRGVSRLPCPHTAWVLKEGVENLVTMLTAFLGGLLTAQDAGEVFPLLMEVGKPLASVAGSRSKITP